MATKPVKLAWLDAEGHVLRSVDLIEKTTDDPFSGGSTGYGFYGKVQLRNLVGDEAEHQVSMNCTEIGSATLENVATAERIKAEKDAKREQIKALRAELKARKV
jgi:hypothetical protein